MSKQQQQSKKISTFKDHAQAMAHIFEKENIKLKPTKFVRNDNLKTTALLLHSQPIVSALETSYPPKDSPTVESRAIILDKTTMYVESGGQLSDTGRIYNEHVAMKVVALHDYHGTIIHEAELVNGGAEGRPKI